MPLIPAEAETEARQGGRGDRGRRISGGFEVSLVYRASSKTARAAQRNSVSKKAIKQISKPTSDQPKMPKQSKSNAPTALPTVPVRSFSFYPGFEKV